MMQRVGRIFKVTAVPFLTKAVTGLNSPSGAIVMVNEPLAGVERDVPIGGGVLALEFFGATGALAQPAPRRIMMLIATMYFAYFIWFV